MRRNVQPLLLALAGIACTVSTPPASPTSPAGAPAIQTLSAPNTSSPASVELATVAPSPATPAPSPDAPRVETVAPGTVVPTWATPPGPAQREGLDL